MNKEYIIRITNTSSLSDEEVVKLIDETIEDLRKKLEPNKCLDKCNKEENKYSNSDIYQKDAMRTCSIPYDNKAGMLRHAVFGLCSESGEVAGILQKVYQGHMFNKEHMMKELGDCLWMIAEACEALDLKISDVMKANIDKLKARYPEGFSADRSLHRQEGDI